MALPPLLVLATQNDGKAREFERLFRGAFVVQPLPPDISLPEETGRTYAENARIKGQAAFRRLGGRVAVLADDSGLEVEALEGRPGILSARFAGEFAGDDDNNRLLLRQLSGSDNRLARFVCALYLIMPPVGAVLKPMEYEATGMLEGMILSSPRGRQGFGYDPVFLPVGTDRTLAEMDGPVKDLLSHRAAAVAALLAVLGTEKENW